MEIKLGDYITAIDEENVIRLIGIVKKEISGNCYDFYLAWDVSSGRLAAVKATSNKVRFIPSTEAEKKMLLERLIEYNKKYKAQ